MPANSDSSSRIKIQVDASPKLRDRAKAVAYERGMNFNEFVLKALAKEGDKELTKLIEAELKDRTRPGRPKQK